MHACSDDVLREQKLERGKRILVGDTDHSSTDLSSCLCEANSNRLFAEALTTKVKTVFADEASLMGTETALTATLSVLTRAREPNSVVGHFEMTGLVLIA